MSDGGQIRTKHGPGVCPICGRANTCHRMESVSTGDVQWFCYNAISARGVAMPFQVVDLAPADEG